METLISCRLCGGAHARLAMRLDDMPRWNHRLLRPSEVAADKPAIISVWRCDACGFVFLRPQLADDYYDDYVNAPSRSSQAQRFQETQATEFVRRFGLEGKSVLEVGCGDGFFLAALQRAGAEVHGIEPSAAQARLALDRGLSVVQGFLTEQPLRPSLFDGFATRQVLEHVVDMQAFLRAIRAQLRPDAVGLVEVPNLDKLVAQRRFFDFIPEHVNYFSPRTLEMVLGLAGFEVLEVSPVDGDESLRAMVRVSTPADFGAVMHTVETLRTAVDGFVSRCRAEGRTVALWGAGGKGLGILAVADSRGIDLLVDGDPAKRGMVTPVSHLQVHSPDEILERGIGAVVVIAPAYEREIGQQLRQDMHFTGPVMLAGNGLRALD